MKLVELRERAEYWRNRLNLKEWKFRIVWASAAELEKSTGFDSVGGCVWCPEELSATVRIRPREKRQEETLVHEMLHVLLQGHMDYDGVYDVNMERAINRIAAALCANEQEK